MCALQLKVAPQLTAVAACCLLFTTIADFGFLSPLPCPIPNTWYTFMKYLLADAMNQTK